MFKGDNIDQLAKKLETAISLSIISRSYRRKLAFNGRPFANNMLELLMSLILVATFCDVDNIVGIVKNTIRTPNPQVIY